MVIVHHLENSRSQRILWLLEELSVSYEVKRYERDKKTGLAPENLRKIHPLGKSPVVEINGQFLVESSNIAQYFLHHFDTEFKLHPKMNSAEYWQYNQWMHFSEGSLMPPLLVSLIVSKVKEAKVPFFIKPITNKIVSQINRGFLTNQISTLFGFIESHLRENTWFVNQNFSAADIMMSFPLEAAMSGRVRPSDYPEIYKFVESIKLRKAYQVAIDKGGPYSY